MTMNLIGPEYAMAGVIRAEVAAWWSTSLTNWVWHRWL